MKKIILVSTAVLSLTVAHGQTTFQKTYGGTDYDYAYSVQQTADGGFIMSGFTFSFGVGSDDFYILKTTSDGTLQWTKTFGGTGSEGGVTVQQTADGGFIMGAFTYSFGAGDRDVYLLKTASDGTLQWTKTYGGTGEDGVYSIQQTADGGFILCGFTWSFGAGRADFYLVKTASDGTLQWAKTFGGTGDDFAHSVQQTADGGFIIGGSTEFGAGGQDVYLLKTASDGTLQWTKTFGGTDYDHAYSVGQTTDGGFIMCGLTKSFGAGDWDVYFLKTASDGTLQWAKTFGGTGVDIASYVQQTVDGGFILCGSTKSFGAGDWDVYFLKTASDGTLQWGKTFGGTGYDGAYSVQQTPDGGFILGGSTYSFGAGGPDVYLIKTDNAGNAGCNESNPATTITTPTSTVTNPTTLLSSGGIAGNPPTQTGSGGIATTLCINAGINESAYENSVSVFPNPFSTQTVFQTDNSFHNATLTVNNCFGQTVAQIKNISGQTVIFSRDNLASGLYFVRLTAGNNIYTDKLVITDK